MYKSESSNVQPSDNSVMMTESSKLLAVNKSTLSQPRINSSKLYTIKHSRFGSGVFTARNADVINSSFLSRNSINESSFFQSRIESSTMTKRSHVKTMLYNHKEELDGNYEAIDNQNKLNLGKFNRNSNVFQPQANLRSSTTAISQVKLMFQKDQERKMYEGVQTPIGKIIK